MEAQARCAGGDSRSWRAQPDVGVPYTKLHCTSWSVDQAAALLFCSAAKAEALGILRSHWIHPLASTESNHRVPVSGRDDLSRCPGASMAGRAALDAGGVRASDLNLVELYSCFPVAVELVANELGIDLSRDLTVTGGMPFAGGEGPGILSAATKAWAAGDSSRRARVTSS